MKTKKPRIKNKTVRVFVYGTLKRGEVNNGLLFGGTLVYETTVKGDLRLIGFLPLLFKGDKTIYGEVWDVPEYIYIPIKQMEESAGYTESVIVTQKKERVRVFLANEKIWKKSNGLAIGNYAGVMDFYKNIV